MPEIFAAGPNAESWVCRLSNGAAVCAFDFGHAASAIYDIVARRRRGEAHDAILLLPEPRHTLLAQVAPAFFAQNTDYDALCDLFDAFSAGALTISGQPQSSYLQQDATQLLICRDALKVADRVLFRSYAEYRRICGALGWYPNRYCIASPPAGCVVGGDGSAQPGIVIWSATGDSIFARVTAFAIRGEFKIPVVVVSEIAIEGLDTIRPEQAEPALREALAIVDLSLYDPSTAVFLAGFGRPLMTPNSNGAEEVCDGLVLFDPSWRKGIVDAAAVALGGAAPAANALSHGIRLAIPAHIKQKNEGPLVSVVVPTFNRRADLEVTLRSIAAQTYENLEIIVVNDAGENVDDVVAPFSRARAINRAENGGLAAARNDGIRAARGVYVAFVDDDDAFFPDHIAELTHAMERSQGTFGRSDAVTRYVERNGSEKRTFCYKMEMDLYVSLSDLYVNNHFNCMVVMIRKAAFDRHGLFDESLPSTEDYEMWLRLASLYPIVHVKRVTGEYTRLTDRSAMTYRLRSRRIDSFTQIYQTYPSGRPVLEARRKATLDWWTARDGVAPAEPSFRMEDPSVSRRVDGNFTVERS
jgi:hypothetical protein